MPRSQATRGPVGALRPRASSAPSPARPLPGGATSGCAPQTLGPPPLSLMTQCLSPMPVAPRCPHPQPAAWVGGGDGGRRRRRQRRGASAPSLGTGGRARWPTSGWWLPVSDPPPPPRLCSQWVESVLIGCGYPPEGFGTHGSYSGTMRIERTKMGGFGVCPRARDPKCFGACSSARGDCGVCHGAVGRRGREGRGRRGTRRARGCGARRPPGRGTCRAAGGGRRGERGPGGPRRGAPGTGPGATGRPRGDGAAQGRGLAYRSPPSRGSKLRRPKSCWMEKDCWFTLPLPTPISNLLIK